MRTSPVVPPRAVAPHEKAEYAPRRRRAPEAWGALLVAGLLAACPSDREGTASQDASVDAGPLRLEEREPNDGPGKALAIDGPATVRANLGADPTKPDEDWYLLKASIPQTADLTATPPPGGDIALEVMDEAATTLLRVNDQGVDGAERLQPLDVPARAWVRVVGVKKGVGGAYALSVGMRPRQPGLELEPNERRVDATAVPLGQSVSGYYGHLGDADWFRFELGPPAADAGAAASGATDEGAAVPAPPAPTAPGGASPAPVDGGDGEARDDAGASAEAASLPAAHGPDAGADAGASEPPRRSLRIDLSGVEGVTASLQVLTEAEAVLFSARSEPGAGLSLRNVGVRASDSVLFVVVRSTVSPAVGKDGGVPATSHGAFYTLTVAPEERPEGAEYEPNDEPAKATELSGHESSREGFISPKGDVDYYRLTTPGPSLAKLQISGVEKLDLQLSLVRSDGAAPEEVVLRVNEGGVKEGELLNNVRCDGACLLKIEAAPRKVGNRWVRDGENGEQPYRLSVSLAPDDGSQEREPNHTPDVATPLTLGRPVRGTVFPKRDVDLYALDLRDRPLKTPVAATLLGILKVDVGLYLHRVGADGKLTLVQTSDTAKGDKTERLRATLEPGLYVFEVRDTKHRESNFQDSYQLNVEEGGG